MTSFELAKLLVTSTITADDLMPGDIIIMDNEVNVVKDIYKTGLYIKVYVKADYEIACTYSCPVTIVSRAAVASEHMTYEKWLIDSTEAYNKGKCKRIGLFFMSALYLKRPDLYHRAECMHTKDGKGFNAFNDNHIDMFLDFLRKNWE